VACARAAALGSRAPAWPRCAQAPPRRARRCPSVAQLLCMKARRCTCLLLPYTRHPDVATPVAYAVLGSLQSTRLLPLPCRRNPKAPTPALFGGRLPWREMADALRRLDPAALGSAEAAHALTACMPRRACGGRPARACAVHARTCVAGAVRERVQRGAAGRLRRAKCEVQPAAESGRSGLQALWHAAGQPQVAPSVR